MSISRQMRDVLIDHIDGAPVEIIRVEIAKGDGLRARDLALRLHTTTALLNRGWLKTRSDRKATLMTDAGRAALAEVLADWADALTRAYYRVLPPEPYSIESVKLLRSEHVID